MIPDVLEILGSRRFLTLDVKIIKMSYKLKVFAHFNNNHRLYKRLTSHNIVVVIGLR